jgi:hypothetical protein
LDVLREEARDFFAFPEAWSDQEVDRLAGQVGCVMMEVAEATKKSQLLAPTALSTVRRNTRCMASALRLKRYETWDQSITWNEDIPIGRTEAGENSYDVPVEEAGQIFRKALDETVDLLNIAEPAKFATPIAPADILKPDADPLARVEKAGEIPLNSAALADSSGGGQAAETQPDISPVKIDSKAEERRALCEAFKRRAKEQRIKATDEKIAKAACRKWNDRTMVTWWKRNDARCTSSHDRLIRAVLSKDPALVWPTEANLKPQPK